MKRILMLATGGTIASKQSDGGLEPVMGANEILRFVPGISELCSVEYLQLMNIDSTDIVPEHWLAMERAIKNSYADFDGFVITSGTDTMAYTAAALSYLVQHSPKPIVITGAQKPIDRDVTDAKTNLLDSFRYAASGAARDVCVVFDGKVIAGTRARKSHSKSHDAFSSLNFPCTAMITDGVIYNYIDSPRFDAPQFFDRLSDRVGLLKLIPGTGSDTLDYLFEKNDAVVIESYGVGGLPSTGGFDEVVERRCAQGKTAVITTQVPNEGSDMSVYRVGARVKRPGVIESRDMILEAIVTKLMWILALTGERREISELFVETVNHDILYKEG